MGQSAGTPYAEEIVLEDTDEILEAGEKFFKQNASLDHIERQLDGAERVETADETRVRYDDVLPVSFYSGGEKGVEIHYSKAAIFARSYEELEAILR